MLKNKYQLLKFLILLLGLLIPYQVSGETGSKKKQEIQRNGIKKTFKTKDYNKQKDDPFGLVYVRVARSYKAIDFIKKGEKIKLKNIDVLDRLPETAHKTGKMNAPGQLIFLSADRTEKILYNCCEDNECKIPKLDSNGLACLPMDPMISFDGKEVIFTVLHKKIRNKKIAGNTLPINTLDSSNKGYAQIHIANLESGKIITQWPKINNVFQTGPIFLPLQANETEDQRQIIFTSNQSGDYRVGLRGSSKSKTAALQLWKAKRNGSNPHRIAPHDFEDSLHPFILSTGRIIYSSWQLNHNLPFMHGNGSPQKFSTLANMFWVLSVDQTGGDMTSVFGAHKGHFTDSLKNSYKALHFFGETSSGWICTTNYYRGNNLGAGRIHCWEPEPQGIEGPYTQNEIKKQGDVFRPRNLINISKWASSGDGPAKKIDAKYTGKLRDPEGIPGNHLMVTLMRGFCTAVQGIRSVYKIQNEPIGCDAGIYRTTQIPSQHPDDLEKIVDSPKFHEFMARAVLNYSEVYGKPQPDPIKIETKRDPLGRCILASSSMLTESDPFHGYRFPDRTACGAQGCKMTGVSVDEVKALRFWKVNPNKQPHWDRTDQSTFNPVSGHVMELLGDVKLLADNSSIVELPCETPYVMAGVDKEGRVIMRDQVPQSLRKGEIRTCTGCHLHSHAGPDFNSSLAAQSFSSPPALGKGTVPMMQNGKIVNIKSPPIKYEFKKHIEPILKSRCVSCHGIVTTEAGLRLDIAGTSKNSTYERLIWDSKQNHVDPAFRFKTKLRNKKKKNKHPYSLSRPYTSKYYHAGFSRESLLLWKAANKRLDGRNDSSLNHDLDFGPNHPVPGITSDELRTISNWMDSGAFADRGR